MNYLTLALTAYKATAEVIYDRLMNVTIICQVFKPMLKSRKFKKLNWSQQAIFNLVRSAANILLMQTLGEYHELKSNMLEKEVSTSPFHPSHYLPNKQQIAEGERDQDDTLYNLTKIDQNTPIGKKKRKDGTQREKADKLVEAEPQQSVGCKMRFLVGYDKGKTFATITISKEELGYQF